MIGRRATIDDVARAAGVSRQTVSNVVRGRGRLAGATRDRVLAAIEQLGYKPHTGAASLRSGRTYRIAYPIPDAELYPGNVIMLEFLRFLVAAARERKHQVLVTGSYGNGLAAIEDLVWTKSVDGFVLATMADDDQRVTFLAERQVPFSCFGRTNPAMPQHWVDIDNRAAIREVTARVLDCGYTSVSYLGYVPQGGWDIEREAGYQEAMTAAGLPVTVTRTGMSPAEVDAAVADLLGSPDRPTAVIAGSDVLAAACYAEASRTGLRIGKDLGVTGFDGSTVARILTPALTTVAMPLAEVADRLVERIVSAVAGVTQEHGEVLAAHLIWGESVLSRPPGVAGGGVGGLRRSLA
jgi:DNA-binding LacI/PurR family transcriptional regulator